MLRMPRLAEGGAAAFFCLFSLGAQAAVLSVGSGGGSLEVEVDEFGASDRAIYDPLGPIGAADTFCQSFIALNDASGYSELTDFGVEATVLAQTASSLRTAFSINFLDFELTQNFAAGTSDVVGATLNQTLSIRNTASVPNSFQLRRYLDGDLGFDGSIDDGGGVIDVGGNRILFEIDSADAGSDDPDQVSPTFVGITATGGQVPSVGRFEVDSYSGLRSRVLNGTTLDDQVAGDGDGDGFVDSAYDITLALQNNFNLAPGQSATYTTQSIFGTSVPPVPGGSEDVPLLPGETTGGPGGNSFVFDIPPEAIVEREIFFIDPDIATGYTYTVTDADFYSVQAPTLAAVNDTDGYTLTVGGTSVSLAPGELIVLADLFGPGVYTEFVIDGIDPDLGLDPTNTLAFVTGISLQNLGANPQVLQTPIVTFVPGAMPIPLPATAWMLISALAGGAAWSRRRARA